MRQLEVARVEKGEMKVKRLTKMNSDGVAYIPCHWRERAEAIDKAISRLSDIEDILGDDYELNEITKLKRAKWIKQKCQGDYGLCSECNCRIPWIPKNYKYCPNCGAKMDLEVK